MMDLAAIQRIYAGSNGDETRALYADLEKLGPRGVIALNLFRACKCSERAKLYRPGPGYRGEAYRRKDWSIENLTSALHADEWHGLEMSWGWAIDQDLRERDDPHHHILYVDLPTGQVSFHCGTRHHGPDYAGKWDGVRDQAADRICRFVVSVIHAGAHKPTESELTDILDRIEEGESALRPNAKPFVEWQISSLRQTKAIAAPLSAALGTAVLGEPVSVLKLFEGHVADSDRLDEQMYAWPMLDVRQFSEPVPCAGARGFWNFT